MKQRFSSLDVKAISQELQASLVSLRLSNVYDLSSKILLLKFAKPENKKQLVIESGFRCHLTDFARTTAPAPSNFVFRLRKFLRTRRVTAVSQIGTDRIIEFQFSDGQYRLYLEFFASGNVILTDHELKILTLLRNVSEGEGQEPQRVGLTYSLDNRQNFGGAPALTKERLRDALTTTVERAAAATQSGAKKIKRKAGGDLRRGLATTITELSPTLVDHALKANYFDATTAPSDILSNDAAFETLFQALEQARSIVNAITGSATVKGYIVAKRRDAEANSGPSSRAAEIKPFVDGASRGLLYEDFSPFLPQQFADDPKNVILEFTGFNQTVDEFFSSLEGQKLESRLTEKEAAAKRKLDAVRGEHAKRIEGLQGTQLLNMRKAAAIEANVERIQEAMDAVISLLEQGMDWSDVAMLIEREKKHQNPVAMIIKLPLKLAEDTITLMVGEAAEGVDEEDNEGYETNSEASDEEDDADAEGGDGAAPTRLAGELLEVDINLNLSPWANAGEYYDQRRSAAEKQEKTIQNSTMALKSAEQKIVRDLKHGLKQEKPVIQPIRRQLWFEKFLWFVSSDGYLVLAGRDAQQNEMLYRRHLRKGDIYVHADLNGAPSVVIKNNPRTPDAPVPPSTLSQAGQLAVCASEAWDSKAGMGAWWVPADQVSKAAPMGEFLPTGSFAVGGKKNFLPPPQLLMGFGLMFKVSEESKVKHFKQHRIYGGLDSANQATSAGREPVTAESTRDDEGENKKPAAPVPEPEPKEVANEAEEGEEEDDEEENSARQNPLQARVGRSTSSQQKPALADNETASQPPAEALAALQVTNTPEVVQDSESLQIQASHEPTPEDLANADNDDENSNLEPLPAEQQTGRSTPTPSIASTTATRKDGGGQPKRGQRGKAKKIAAKYKDQDDEDRATAEQLLGAAAGRLKREAEAKARAEAQAAAAAASERRRAQHQRRQQETAAHEEARRRLMDENNKTGGGGGRRDGAAAIAGAGSGGGGGGGEDEEVADDLAVLEALVGTPLPGDEILEVLPVCAPYAAMTRVKYKAKMQPGPMKKGKAVKEVLEGWKSAAAAAIAAVAAGKKGGAAAKQAVDESATDTERMWPREVELIKGIKPEEAVNCVPVGKVKLMLSGGTSGGGGGGGGDKSSKGKKGKR